MPVHPLIPMIEIFRNLTFKIQGQSHSSGSHNRHNILSPHIPFIPCWSALPFSEMQLFKKLTFKIQGQCHGWRQSSKSHCESTILLTHIPFVPCQSDIPLLSYDFFKIWPWNSRVKVKDEVTVQNHNVGVTSYRLTSLSFHVIGPPISEIQLFQNLTLKIKGQGHGWGHTLKSQCRSNILSTHIPFAPCQGHGWGHCSKTQCGSNILSTHIPFVPCQSAISFLKYNIFKIWPWKSRIKVKWPWCCTTIGLDNSIELRMV